MGNLKFSVFPFALILLCIVEGSSAGCSFELNEDLPKKEPIFLRLKGENIEFFHPEGPTIEIEQYEQLVLACSGSKNYITALKNSTSVVYGKCKSDQDLNVGSQTFPLSELGCDKTIAGNIITSNEPCGNGKGTWNDIGFDVRDSQVGFLNLFRVCYDQKTGSVVYTEHVLPGTSVADREKKSSRPSFKSIGTPEHVSPAKAYTREAQKETFASLLGSSAEAEKYFEGGSAYLSRGHMSPDGDFTFVIWQYATYFYVNACPLWQAVNVGNWLRVENLVRKLGSSRGEDLTIYTGVHEVLTLPDINGNEVPMHLSEGGNILIPKWIWKIIYSPNSNEGIAFVSLNNPYAAEIKEGELLCKSVCKETGFEDTNFEKMDKGYTYCCTVKDLSAVVKTIPKLVIKNVMKA